MGKTTVDAKEIKVILRKALYNPGSMPEARG